MIVDNPLGLKKAEILVGIPSFNEADNIGFVAEQVSRGLEQYFPNKISAVINVDNHSTDQTKEVFFASEGKIPKIYVSTKPSFKGKGYNLYNFFLMMQQMDAKVGIVVDADLKSITPEWIKEMATPILNGYQFLSPYYMRLENEATITNHLAYPLVYGLFGFDQRQPIGGDYAFSDKMVDWWLEQKWPQAAFVFGVDIFMSLNALLTGGKNGQVNLGKKIHRITNPSSLDRMFGQVAESLFSVILENKDKIASKSEVEDIAILGGVEIPALSDLKPDYAPYKSVFFEKFDTQYNSLKGLVSADVYKELKTIQRGEKLLIDSDLWSKLIYDILIAYDANGQDFSVIEALKCFYFGRVASFFEETTNLTPSQSEREIVAQAQVFFENRKYFLQRQKK